MEADRNGHMAGQGTACAAERVAAHVAEQKQAWRRERKAQAAKLTEAYCKEADAKILGRIVSLPEYQEADTIFCYVGMSHEIDTIPILEDAWKKGKRVCVPKCVGNGIMEAYQIDGMEDLRTGSYGILEPSEAARKLFPEEIELALVPCLSCSADGRRLGYGGGYYDRYLGGVEATKAVLCRKQMMREKIPVDAHDLWMELVICEDEVIRNGKTGASR